MKVFVCEYRLSNKCDGVLTAGTTVRDCTHASIHLRNKECDEPCAEIRKLHDGYVKQPQCVDTSLIKVKEPDPEAESRRKEFIVIAGS